MGKRSRLPNPAQESDVGVGQSGVGRATCSPLIKQNTQEHSRIFLMWALPLSRGSDLKGRAVCAAGTALAAVTWIEVRSGPWGASHSAIGSSISWGSGRLQWLHSEAIREQVWMELCAGPQLREGENKRDGEGKLVLGLFAWKSIMPEGSMQSNPQIFIKQPKWGGHAA